MYAILYDFTISSYTFCWIPSLFLSRAKIASSTAFTYFSGLPIPEMDTSKIFITILKLSYKYNHILFFKTISLYSWLLGFIFYTSFFLEIGAMPVPTKQMVGFRNLVGAGIAPVSNKAAFKQDF